MFDVAAQEKLQYYVYALFDPDAPTCPFYIGKGKGNRVFQHAAGELREDDTNDCLSAKTDLIRQIRSRGKSVIQKIVRSKLLERKSLIVEAALIDIVNHIRPETLKNEISGQGIADGFFDALELATAMKATPLQTNTPLLLIKIGKRWNRLIDKYGTPNGISTNDIYEAVRGNWKIRVDRAETSAPM